MRISIGGGPGSPCLPDGKRLESTSRGPTSGMTEERGRCTLDAHVRWIIHPVSASDEIQTDLERLYPDLLMIQYITKT